MRVLIVEDNVTYAGLVAARLAQSGFDSDQASSVREAKHAISQMEYAAILLDLGLPDQDGATLLHDLRSQGDSTPVLIVTARNSLRDRIKGLREGADDYLAKPFSMDELIARLHALLRRPSNLLGQVLSAGNVSLDVESRQLMVNGQVQLFRLREMTVLELLMRHKGSAVARRIFENQLFGISGEQDSNTVDVYIHRLRTQLADAGASVKIHTIRGVGYMMSDDIVGQGER
jgi:DNA-binding response OmpR family regulator